MWTLSFPTLDNHYKGLVLLKITDNWSQNQKNLYSNLLSIIDKEEPRH